MKKKILLSLLATTTLLNADSKTELLSSDATLKQSSRQAVMGIADLGLEAKKFTFPAYYTPAGKNAKTTLIGNWRVDVRENYMDSILADNYDFLIPSRFDKLIFNKDKATILTATKDVSVEMSTKEFSYSTGSLEDYQTKTLEYLNSEIAPKVQKVLSEASDARYKEMPSDEAESFIKDRAKETGLPASVLQTLINSSFVFDVYMEKMEGSLNISQSQYKDANGRIVTYYTTSLSAPLNLDLTVYEFKDGKFSIHSAISSVAKSLFGGIGKMMSGTSGVRTPFLPSEKDAQKVFDDVIKVSFKDNMLALTTRLKEDDAFKVSAPLSVDGSSVEMSIGNQEDIRVDHPFSIRRSVDGESKTVGYFKVRKPGNSCLLLKESQRTASVGSVFIGSAEEADMGYEHPWSGVFGQVYGKTVMSTFNYNDVDTKGGALNAVGLGFQADLGYVLNNPALSEVWTNIDMFVGAGSEGTMSIGSYSYSTSSFALGFTAGLEKRFYLMSGLFVSGAADMNFEAQSFDMGNYSTDTTTLSLSTLSLEPKVKIGYNFSPNLDIKAFVGYDVALSTSAAYKIGNNNSVSIDGYTKNSGVTAGFVLDVHTDFAGPFAKMFKKPSTACNDLKK